MHKHNFVQHCSGCLHISHPPLQEDQISAEHRPPHTPPPSVTALNTKCSLQSGDSIKEDIFLTYHYQHKSQKQCCASSKTVCGACRPATVMLLHSLLCLKSHHPQRQHHGCTISHRPPVAAQHSITAMK